MITFNSFPSGSIFTLHTRKKQKSSGGEAAKIIKDFFLGRFLKGTSQCLKSYKKVSFENYLLRFFAFVECNDFLDRICIAKKWDFFGQFPTIVEQGSLLKQVTWGHNH